MPRNPLPKLRRLCLAFPEVTERLSHGEPAWFAGNKTFVMFADHHHDDRLAFWCAALVIAFSLVMLRIGQTFWTGLGWIGIGAGVFSTLGAFALAAESFTIAGLIGVILEIIWFLGVGVGLWRGLPGEEAQPETAGRQ